jgi:hypothetical protein
VNFVDPLGLFFFSGPGFTNVMPNAPPSYSEISNAWSDPGTAEVVNLHQAIPGQFAIMGPLAIIKTAPYIQKGIISPMSNLMKYGTPVIIIINPDLFKDSNAEAAEPKSCP